MAKSSCIWDPLIYLWTNRQFRIAFYKTMPCKSLGEKLLQRDELKHKETESSQPQEPQELRHKSNRLTPLRQTTTKQGPGVSVSEYGQKTETMGVSQINVPHVVVQGPSKIGNVCQWCAHAYWEDGIYNVCDKLGRIDRTNWYLVRGLFFKILYITTSTYIRWFNYNIIMHVIYVYFR